MPQTVFDSGWVPAASGAINAAIMTDDYQFMHVYFASSGTNAAVSAALSSMVGGGGMVPRPPGAWNATRRPEYGVSPALTATYAGVASPGAGLSTDYFLSMNPMSGSAGVLAATLNVSLTPGSASWARVVIEGT
jgi:hypothetical protein